MSNEAGVTDVVIEGTNLDKIHRIAKHLKKKHVTRIRRSFRAISISYIHTDGMNILVIIEYKLNPPLISPYANNPKPK